MDHMPHMDHSNHGQMEHMNHNNMNHNMPKMDFDMNLLNTSDDVSSMGQTLDVLRQGHGSHGGHGGHVSSGAHTEHGAHSMIMTFHGGCNEVILFSWWKVEDVGEFVGSFFAIFLMALLYEGNPTRTMPSAMSMHQGASSCMSDFKASITKRNRQVLRADPWCRLKYYRKHLLWKTYTGLQYCAVSPPDKRVSNICATDEPQVIQPVPHVLERNVPTMLSTPHAWQTFLHGVQVLVSYMLMLVFMTYNTWLCAAVVLGSATGYFLFGWRESVVVDFTEHCH